MVLTGSYIAIYKYKSRISYRIKLPEKQLISKTSECRTTEHNATEKNGSENDMKAIFLNFSQHIQYSYWWAWWQLVKRELIENDTIATSNSYLMKNHCILPWENLCMKALKINNVVEIVKVINVIRLKDWIIANSRGSLTIWMLIMKTSFTFLK